jgi:hypothetical protein
MSLSRRPDAGVPPPPPPPSPSSPPPPPPPSPPPPPRSLVAEEGEGEEELVRVVVKDDVLLRTRDKTAISGQFSVVSIACPPPFSRLPPCRVEGKEDEEDGLSHSPPRGASCTLCERRKGKSMGACFRSATRRSRSWSCRRAFVRAWLRAARL